MREKAKTNKCVIKVGKVRGYSKVYLWLESCVFYWLGAVESNVWLGNKSASVLRLRASQTGERAGSKVCVVLVA